TPQGTGDPTQTPKISLGVIIGIIVAAVVVVAATSFFIYYRVKTARQLKHNGKGEPKDLATLVVAPRDPQDHENARKLTSTYSGNPQCGTQQLQLDDIYSIPRSPQGLQSQDSIPSIPEDDDTLTEEHIEKIRASQIQQLEEFRLEQEARLLMLQQKLNTNKGNSE
ncbi:hypothetical protein BGX26_007005, partial [Mortierella sp. AD094]